MKDCNLNAADNTGCHATDKSKESQTTFLELARKRFSVRSYSSRAIEEDKLRNIIEAGRVAPTAANKQPQRIYVLQSSEALSKIRAITSSTYDAPTVLLVCYDERVSWKRNFADGYDSGDMDTTIVCTHIMLEAEEQGVGSCWVLLFEPDAVSKAFHLPEHIRPVCLLALGYPSEKSRPSASHDDRRPAGDTVTFM